MTRKVSAASACLGIVTALGAVFVAAGLMAITPATAVAVLLILTTIYVSLKATAARVPASHGH